MCNSFSHLQERHVLSIFQSYYLVLLLTICMADGNCREQKEPNKSSPRWSHPRPWTSEVAHPNDVVSYCTCLRSRGQSRGNSLLGEIYKPFAVDKNTFLLIYNNVANILRVFIKSGSFLA